MLGSRPNTPLLQHSILCYQYEASRGYNPAPRLESIKARLLAINSADDERNPPELGILEREIKRVKQGRYVLIPASEETRGHGTTGMAKLWKHYLAELMHPPSRRQNKLRVAVVLVSFGRKRQAEPAKLLERLERAS